MELERLAPELLDLIMRAVDSPETLSSLLSASPSCWRLFSSSPERILTSVVRNAIPPELIKHYLAIINAPSFNSDKQDFRERVSIFLEWYLTSESFVYPTAKEDIVSVCRLHTMISCFADGYFESAIKELTNNDKDVPVLASITTPKIELEKREDCRETPTGSITFADPLKIESRHDFRAFEWYFRDFCSRPVPYVVRLDREIVQMYDATRQPVTMAFMPTDSERIRFLRAFLRFEVFCRVFPDGGTRGYREGTHSAREQCDLFINKLQAWEVEEMSCAHQYCSSIMTGFIGELKNDLLEAVVTTPGVVFPWSRLERNQSRTDKDVDKPADCFEKLVSFEALNLIGMDIYEQAIRDRMYHTSDGYISYLSSLGVSFVYKLLRSDKATRSTLIRSNLIPYGRPSLPEAIRGAEFRNSRTIQPDDIGDDNPGRANLGYFLFKSTPENGFMPIRRIPLGTPMRDLAYVFWDSWRIRIYPIWRKLYDAIDVSEDKMKERLDRRVSKSPEERLRGVKIPWGERLRISKQFGSIDRTFGDPGDGGSE